MSAKLSASRHPCEYGETVLYWWKRQGDETNETSICALSRFHSQTGWPRSLQEYHQRWHSHTQHGDIVYFQFNNDSIMLSVELYSTDLNAYINSTSYRLETFSGIECWIESSEAISYYNVIFVQDNCTYNMSIKNIEILPLIMENLRRGEWKWNLIRKL